MLFDLNLLLGSIFQALNTLYSQLLFVDKTAKANVKWNEWICLRFECCKKSLRQNFDRARNNNDAFNMYRKYRILSCIGWVVSRFFFFFDCSASHGNDDDWFSFNKIDVMARCGWCAGAWPHQDEDKVFNINRLRQKSTSSVDMAFWLLQNGWLCVQFIIFTINVLWDNLHNSLTKMISLLPVSKSFSRVFHAIVEKLPNQNSINWIWSW